MVVVIHIDNLKLLYQWEGNSVLSPDFTLERELLLHDYKLYRNDENREKHNEEYGDKILIVLYA